MNELTYEQLQQELSSDYKSLISYPDDEALTAICQLYQQKPAELLTAEMLPTVMANCLYITNKAGDRQLLCLNKTQRRLLEAIEYQQRRGLPIRIIILKARQEGISTFIEALLYLWTICIPNTGAGIIADTDGNTQLLSQKCSFFYDNSPTAMQPVKKYDRRDVGMVFGELNSRIDIMVATEARSAIAGKTGRSRTYQFLHRSEVAFWGNPRATMNALNQTVPNREGTAIIDESTANGWGDDFHTDWERAMAGKSDALPVFFAWWFHDEYNLPFMDEKEQRELENSLGETEDAEYGNELHLLENYPISLEQLNWRRRTVRNECGGSLQTFQREYPTFPEEAFQATGEHALDVPALVYYGEQTKPPAVVGDLVQNKGWEIVPKATGFVRVWEQPEPYAEYVIGSDHAQGLDWHDFNYAVVIRRLPLQLVAEMSGHDGRRIQPDDFGEMLAWLGLYYNQAWICSESNNDGGKAITVLTREAKYTRLVWEDQMKLSTVHRVGWQSNNATRRLVISELQEIIKDQAIELWSEMTQKCGMAFVYINGKPQAVKKGQPRKAGDPLWQYIDCPLLALGSALLAHARLPAPKPMELVRQNYKHPRVRQVERRKKLEKGILSYV